MATTEVLSGLELTKWVNKFLREFVRDSGFEPYMGDSPGDIIHVKTDLESDGYTLRVPLVGRAKGDGVAGNQRLAGSEESLDQYYQDITWEFYRHAIETTKKEKKKSATEFMSVARPLLREWAAEKIKYQVIDCFHNMTDGTLYSAASAGTRNTFVTNNSDRILFGAAQSNASSGVMATALGNVDSTSDKLTTSVASLAKRKARLASPHIRPFKTGTGGREYFVMFVHPFCFRDLKQDTVMVNANRDARAREGSSMDSNPLFQDGDLIYDGIIFREIPEFYLGRQGGINTATHLEAVGNGSIDVGVNFLCGAQSIGMVRKQDPLPTKKNEDDYGFVDGVGIEMAHGFSKLRWNNGSGTAKDVGMVTVYAAATPDT